MRIAGQSIDFKMKRLVLALLAICGICMHAVAQTPTNALPPLAALPALPGATTNTTSVAALPAPTSATAVPQAPVPASPPIPAGLLPKPYTTTETKSEPKADPNIAPAEMDLPPVVLDAEGAIARPTATARPEPETPTTVLGIEAPVPLAPPPSLPGLALPVPGTTPTDSAATQLANDTATSLMGPQVPGKDDNNAGKRSWETTLEPTEVHPTTKFIYKRSIMPGEIYRTEYNRDNRHLPKRVTRDDYANLLFTSVAKNDVEATRALLNAGTGLEITTVHGETPLALAQRVGATEVTQLLIARGALN